MGDSSAERFVRFRSKSARKALLELMPRYVRQHPSSDLTGEIDNFSLTLAGLLGSSKMGEASMVIDRVLRLIAGKFNADPTFTNYTLDEVRTAIGGKGSPDNFASSTVQIAGLSRGGWGSGSEFVFGAPGDAEYLSDHCTFSDFLKYLNGGWGGRPPPTAPLLLPDDSTDESGNGLGHNVPMADSSLAAKWSRLKMSVRAVEAVVKTQPKVLAVLKPQVESALEILERPFARSGAEELMHILERIEGFVAKWRPRPGHSYLQPAWARDTDEETQEARRILNDVLSSVLSVSDAESLSPAPTPTENRMKVFVSHSSVDKAIAQAFVNLLEAAFHLQAKDIRCTSVDGYKLPAGTNSDEQLRQEVFEAQSFVALLSPASLKSVYVMFELGARWGAKGHLIPVLVGGVDPGVLRPPLSAIHAIAGTSEGDVHQLIGDLGDKLNLTPEKPNAYAGAMRSFMDAARGTKTIAT